MNRSQLAVLVRHTEELNRLVRESLSEALLRLMGEKPYEKIRITELCSRAGVSRMAFYGNFQTKDDILRETIVELNRELVRRMGSPFRSTTSKDWYVRFFAFVKEKSEVLKKIFDAGFENKYLLLVNNIVLADPSIPQEKKYQRLIWSGGIENAMVYWPGNGMRETEEEMADYCAAYLVPWSLKK